jgi:hypothetical protein
MTYATLKIFAVFAAAALMVAATLGHTQQAKAISESTSASIRCINDECHIVECVNDECNVDSSSGSPSTTDSITVETEDISEDTEEPLTDNDELRNSLNLFD